MTKEKSVRDQLLASSSPVITLVVILAVIVSLLLIVFVAWVRFRKRTGGKEDLSSPYNVLLGESSFNSLYENVGANPVLLTSREPASVFEDGGRSPAEVVLPESVVVELGKASHGFGEHDSRDVSRELHAGMEPDPLSAEACTSDLSIEALTASHKRLVEQRERFLSDAKHFGLRHMAVEHLRIQQRYEKQIMALKARLVHSN